MSDVPWNFDTTDPVASAEFFLEHGEESIPEHVAVELVAEAKRLRAMEKRARELGAGRANGPYGQGVNDACRAILGEK